MTASSLQTVDSWKLLNSSLELKNISVKLLIVFFLLLTESLMMELSSGLTAVATRPPAMCRSFQKSRKFQEEIWVYRENPFFTPPWWSVMSWHGMIWHALAPQHSNRIAWPLGPIYIFNCYGTDKSIGRFQFFRIWVNRFNTHYDHGTLRSITSDFQEPMVMENYLVTVHT